MGLPLQLMSLTAFLEWENAHADKHEYHRGEVFLMVGGRREHGRVVANLVRQLGNRIEGSPCQVFAEGMKVQIGEDTILYPDVFVTCDQADLATDMIFRAPKLVIEVLSPSTQAYDRSQKFALYRRLDSLQEYVLIDPDNRRVEAFRRNDQNQWVLDDMSLNETLALPCVKGHISMSQVFDGIDPTS